MKKENKKNSPNRLTCQISRKTRMSNKTYIADKANKVGVSSNVWASFYINKDEYKKLVGYIEEQGFNKACEEYGIDSKQLSKWIKFNGRGKFVKQVQVKTEVVKEEELQTN
tara:strand:- start:1 stop:333 length:333 start_codon:yes stop_codon:yes gene_type:complete